MTGSVPVRRGGFLVRGAGEDELLTAVLEYGVFGGFQHTAGMPLFHVAGSTQFLVVRCLCLLDRGVRAVAAYVDWYVSHVSGFCRWSSRLRVWTIPEFRQRVG